MAGEPKLYLLDLEGLVGNINSILLPGEGPLEIDGFVPKNPKKNPFLYKSNERQMLCRGKYPLTRETSSGVYAFLSMPDDEDVGYIFVENGCIGSEEDNDFDGIYETIEMRIKQPLELHGKTTLPKCNIKILLESYNHCSIDSPNPVERIDRIRRFGLFWMKEDLSRIIPTSWFIKSDIDYREFKYSA